MSRKDEQVYRQQMLLREASRSRSNVLTGERRCLACGKPFLSLERLAQHLQDAHDGSNTPGTAHPPQGPGPAAERTAYTLGDALFATARSKPVKPNRQTPDTRMPPRNAYHAPMPPRGQSSSVLAQHLTPIQTRQLHPWHTPTSGIERSATGSRTAVRHSKHDTSTLQQQPPQPLQPTSFLTVARSALPGPDHRRPGAAVASSHTTTRQRAPHTAAAPVSSGALTAQRPGNRGAGQHQRQHDGPQPPPLPQLPRPLQLPEQHRLAPPRQAAALGRAADAHASRIQGAQTCRRAQLQTVHHPAAPAGTHAKRKKRPTALKRAFRRAQASQGVARWLEVLGEVEEALQTTGELAAAAANELQMLGCADSPKVASTPAPTLEGGDAELASQARLLRMVLERASQQRQELERAYAVARRELGKAQESLLAVQGGGAVPAGGVPLAGMELGGRQASAPAQALAQQAGSVQQAQHSDRGAQDEGQLAQQAQQDRCSAQDCREGAVLSGRGQAGEAEFQATGDPGRSEPDQQLSCEEGVVPAILSVKAAAVSSARPGAEEEGPHTQQRPGAAPALPLFRPPPSAVSQPLDGEDAGSSMSGLNWGDALASWIEPQQRLPGRQPPCRPPPAQQQQHSGHLAAPSPSLSQPTHPAKASAPLPNLSGSVQASGAGRGGHLENLGGVLCLADAAVQQGQRPAGAAPAGLDTNPGPDSVAPVAASAPNPESAARPAPESGAPTAAAGGHPLPTPLPCLRAPPHAATPAAALGPAHKQQEQSVSSVLRPAGGEREVWGGGAVSCQSGSSSEVSLAWGDALASWKGAGQDVPRPRAAPAQRATPPAQRSSAPPGTGKQGLAPVLSGTATARRTSGGTASSGLVVPAGQGMGSSTVHEGSGTVREGGGTVHEGGGAVGQLEGGSVSSLPELDPLAGAGRAGTCSASSSGSSSGSSLGLAWGDTLQTWAASLRVQARGVLQGMRLEAGGKPGGESGDHAPPTAAGEGADAGEGGEAAASGGVSGRLPAARGGGRPAPAAGEGAEGGQQAQQGHSRAGVAGGDTGEAEPGAAQEWGGGACAGGHEGGGGPSPPQLPAHTEDLPPPLPPAAQAAADATTPISIWARTVVAEAGSGSEGDHQTQETDGEEEGASGADVILRWLLQAHAVPAVPASPRPPDRTTSSGPDTEPGGVGEEQQLPPPLAPSAAVLPPKVPAVPAVPGTIDWQGTAGGEAPQEAAAAAPQRGGKGGAAAGGAVLFCGVCQVTVSGEANYQQHLLSRKHAKRLAQQAQHSVPQQAQQAVQLAQQGERQPPRAYVGVAAADVAPYVDQVISAELNEVALELLRRLLGWQERVRANDPHNFKRKRRLVSGMREVGKLVKSRKAKAVLVAPNISAIQGEEGDQYPVAGLLQMARERGIPVVFALSRQRMGKVFGPASRKRASAFAVLDYDGANDLFKRMLALAEEGNRAWVEGSCPDESC